MRDIYHSIRGHFRRCLYYVRNEDESVGDLSKWILKKQPKGVFYAKEVNAKLNQSGKIAEVLYSEDLITIETNDETPELERGCVVVYRNSNWLVESVQRAIHIKETEFSEEEHCTTTISLRR